MPTKNASENDLVTVAEKSISQVSRRNFLGYLGGASALLITAAACKKTESWSPSSPAFDMGKSLSSSSTVDLGSGDVGILNYAYVLEQIEAAFYTKVVAHPYQGISANEMAMLTDIRDHEVAHREFFKAALGTSAIPTLELNFSSIDFGSRASVLGTAKAFEDLGVSAYNGAGQLLTNPTYLLLAGKIVSVEGRHAAYIRDLLTPGSFADNLDMTASDISRTPAQVFAIAGAYVKTKINYSNLPTS